MAIFSPLDERNTAPYQLKGRWYHMFVEGTGERAVLTSSDISGAFIGGGNALFLPVGYHINDFKIDVHFIASTSYTPTFSYYEAGSLAGFKLPEVSKYDYLDLYLFCTRHED